LLPLTAPPLLLLAAAASASIAAAALRLKELIDTAIRSCSSFSLALLLLPPNRPLPLLLPPPILDKLLADADGRRIRWPLQVDEVSGSNTSNTWGSGARVVEDAAQLIHVLRGVRPAGESRGLLLKLAAAAAAAAAAAGPVLMLPLLLARLNAAVPGVVLL
jgi:hypothetical protein